MGSILSGMLSGKKKKVVNVKKCIFSLCFVSMILILIGTRSIQKPGIRYFQYGEGDILACSIPDACLQLSWTFTSTRNLTRGGVTTLNAIFLPQYLEEYEDFLRRRCILPRTKIHYYGENSDSGLENSLKKRLEYDLIGVPFTGKHLRHFAHAIYDFVLHNMSPASIFLTEWYKNLNCVDLRTGEACSSWFIRSINPKLVVGRPFLNSSWNTGFIELVSESVKNSVLKTNFDPTVSGPQCFRSALTSQIQYDSGNMLLDIFQARGIKRKFPFVKPGTPCKLKILIALRNYTRVARTIPKENAEPLVKKIQSDMESNGINADVELIVNLGTLTFKEQVQKMQSIDMLLSVHGAELSNAIFMRMGSVIIEIEPFGFHSGYFDKVCKPSHVQVERIVAAPDPQKFHYCAERFHVGQAKTAIIKEYNERLWKFNNCTDPIEKSTIGAYFGKAHVCAKRQRVLNDPGEISATVLRTGMNFCEKRGMAISAES